MTWMHPRRDDVAPRIFGFLIAPSRSAGHIAGINKIDGTPERGSAYDTIIPSDTTIIIRLCITNMTKPLTNADRLGEVEAAVKKVMKHPARNGKPEQLLAGDAHQSFVLGDGALRFWEGGKHLKKLRETIDGLLAKNTDVVINSAWGLNSLLEAFPTRAHNLHHIYNCGAGQVSTNDTEIFRECQSTSDTNLNEVKAACELYNDGLKAALSQDGERLLCRVNETDENYIKLGESINKVVNRMNERTNGSSWRHARYEYGHAIEREVTFGRARGISRYIQRRLAKHADGCNKLLESGCVICIDGGNGTDVEEAFTEVANLIGKTKGFLGRKKPRQVGFGIQVSRGRRVGAAHAFFEPPLDTCAWLERCTA